MQPIENMVFNGNNIRSFIDDCGMVWFVASDVSGILGYRDPFNMVRMLSGYEKGTHIVSTPGGMQEMVIINEPGIYHCIISSRRPEAVDFQRWVCETVLPSIRRSGAYITPELRQEIRQDTTVVMGAVRVNDEIDERNKLYRVIEHERSYQAYKQQLKINEEMKEKVQQEVPYTNMGHAFINMNGEFSLDTAAKILNAMGVNVGRTRLCEWLRRDGYLMKKGNQNRPLQAVINRGLMHEGSMIADNGDMVYVPVFTQLGLMSIINRYAPLTTFA